MDRFVRLTVISFVAALAAPALGQPIVFVDRTAPAGGNGSSWALAYNTLQAALDAARANSAIKELRVAQGTYKPDRGPGRTPNDRSASFALVTGAAIRGGYAGLAGADPDARNPATFVSVLSGDLGGDDGPNFANYVDNSYHVVSGVGTGSTALLEGFTVRGGSSEASFPLSEGGGILIGNGSCTIRNCTIRENTAVYGGGVYIENGSPKLQDCLFTANRVINWGAGVYNCGGSLTAINCRFETNNAGVWGGGVFAEGGSTSLLSCLFLSNTALSGGAVTAVEGTQTLVNCRFLGNSAAIDGGAFAAQAGTRSFANCLFSGNHATQNGGAISSPGLTIADCTFSRNTAGGQGGGVFGASPTITNSILWGNTDVSGTTQESQVAATGSPAVDFTCMQGFTAMARGVGNIGTDPRFVNATGADTTPGTLDDDLRLAPRSPCIDAGDNDDVPTDALDLNGNMNTSEPLPLDLDNAPRFRNDAGMPDTGIGSAPIVDMGAYEFQGTSPSNPCPADITGDGIVNSADLGQLLGAWGTGPSPSDISGDGTVNAADLGLLLGAWGACP